jgi:hypothetical protein
MNSAMKGKKRKAEIAFIRAVRNMICRQCIQYKIVIIGDREFAGKEFVKNILRIKNTEVVIRIKKNTDVTDIRGNIIRLREYKKSIYDCFYGENKGIMYIDNNDEDKVIVFGSMTDIGLVKRFYERRMGIEEMFGDMKTGLGLKTIRTKNRQRFKNLTVFSLLTYLVIVKIDVRLKEKNEYFSFFSTVIYRAVIEPCVLTKFFPFKY